jgi:hypothetical protein
MGFGWRLLDKPTVKDFPKQGRALMRIPEDQIDGLMIARVAEWLPNTSPGEWTTQQQRLHQVPNVGPMSRLICRVDRGRKILEFLEECIKNWRYPPAEFLTNPDLNLRTCKHIGRLKTQFHLLCPESVIIEKRMQIRNQDLEFGADFRLPGPVFYEPAESRTEDLLTSSFSEQIRSQHILQRGFSDRGNPGVDKPSYRRASFVNCLLTERYAEIR